MSYLLQHARRLTSNARVDEYIRLNRPGLYGDAFVRVFVEDTSRLRRRKQRDPRTSLKIGDCANTIALEFSLEDATYRENSLYKIDTLIGALTRFRNALAAEAALRTTNDT
jgi:hypothetical protein